MRKSILIAAAAAMLVVASAASAQGRPERIGPSVAFFTPPIGNVDSFVDNTFEASFVSTGTAPIAVTIELCALNGVCYVSGFTCASVPLPRGLGCSTGNLVADEPLYAKFRVRPTGGGTVDGMGSLRVIAPDGTNSAAVQTHGPVPDRAVTEQ
jgi:hypothetical protein